MMGGTDSRFFTSSFNIKIHRNPGCASPKGRTYEEKKKLIQRCECLVILLSAVISEVNNLTSVINYCNCLKMMKKDSVRLYGYSILPLMIKDLKIHDYIVLGAWTAMQKSVLR